MFAEIILFIFIFRLLRKYAGGDHAKTARRCYISSLFIYTAVLFAIKYYPFANIITVPATLLSSLIICVLAPVEALNKPLDELEYKVYRFRSWVYTGMITFLYLLLDYIEITYCHSCYWANAVAVSIIAVMISAVIGKLKLIYNKRQI